MKNVLKRTTLIVRDAGRSAQFYREVLGLSVWYDDEIVLGGRGLAAGRRGDRTRLVIMKAEDPVIGMIGLLQFTDPPLPEPEGERTRLGIGDVVFGCRPMTSAVCTGGCSITAHGSTRNPTTSSCAAPTAPRSP